MLRLAQHRILSSRQVVNAALVAFPVGPSLLCVAIIDTSEIGAEPLMTISAEHAIGEELRHRI